jgi:hypothetical protein
MRDQIELGVVRDAYPALARWVGRDLDNETFIQRRFSKLAAQKLCNLQAQLIAIEHEIDKLDEAARQNGRRSKLHDAGKTS